MSKFFAFILLWGMVTIASAQVGNLFSGGPAPSVDLMTWQRMEIPGGGYVRGMSMALDGARVARTDISNAYIRKYGAAAWKACITSEHGFILTTATFGALAVGIAPSNSDIVYVMWNTTGGTTFDLYRSTDACDHFTLISSVPATNGNVLSNAGQNIVIDPNNPLVVYVGTSNGVYRATDGVNFTALFPGPFLQPPYSAGIAIDINSGTTTLTGTPNATASNKVYVPITGLGVEASTDGGNTFSLVSGGIPSITKNVSTSSTNAVVYLSTAILTDGANGDVTNCTASGLTFAKRVTYLGYFWRQVTWWAYAPTVLTNLPVTCTLAGYGPSSFPYVQSIGINGADVSGLTPFDANVSLPNSVAYNTYPTGQTTSANTIMISGQVNDGGSTTTQTPGWTCLDCTPATMLEYKTFSSPSGSVTATTSGTGGFNNTSYIDAIKCLTTCTVDNYSISLTVTVPTTPYLVDKGQIGCDGTYYVTEPTLGFAWRYDGSAFSWTKFAPGFANAFGVYPHPTACAKIVVISPRTTDFAQSDNHGTNFSAFPSFNFEGTVGQMGVLSPDALVWNYARATEGMPPLDAGDCAWNPVSIDLECATGLQYYKMPMVIPYVATDWTQYGQGMQSVVPHNMMSVPGGNMYFGAIDNSMYANLAVSPGPATNLPLKGQALRGCTDIQYQGQDINNVYAMCMEFQGFQNSSYTLNGGITDADWNLNGRVSGNVVSYITNQVPPGTTNNREGGSIAPNACDKDNVLWAQLAANFGGPYGNVYRSTNYTVAGAVFVGSISGTTLTVTSVTSGSIAVGQGIYGALGSGVPDLAYIVSGSGTTWTIDQSATVAGGTTMNSGIRFILIPQTDFPGAPTTGYLGWGNQNNLHPHHIMVADKVDCDTFYAFNDAVNILYKTTNKGVTWTAAHSGAIVATDSYIMLQSVPGKAGWLYMNGQGTTMSNQLAFTHDNGTTWASCGSLGAVISHGYGKAKPGGGGNPAVFVSGGLSPFGIYRSDDDCANWTLIGSSQPGPNALQGADNWPQYGQFVWGDMNVYGRACVGMQFGSGWICGTLNYLLERDIDPASNDNSPVGLAQTG